MHLLNFDFVAILNLFVLLVWSASGYYTSTQSAESPPGKNAIAIIMLLLTVIAVVLDIFFLVLALVH